MKIRTLIAASLFAISSLGPVALAAENSAETSVTQESVASQPTININTATEAELTKIKGVGEIKSKAIVKYRDEIGEFDSVEQLLEVSGIGQSILDNNPGLLTVK